MSYVLGMQERRASTLHDEGFPFEEIILVDWSRTELLQRVADKLCRQQRVSSATMSYDTMSCTARVGFNSYACIPVSGASLPATWWSAVGGTAKSGWRDERERAAQKWMGA